jgi:regulator of sigma E protease
MKTGDRVISISGKEVRAFTDIQAEVFFSEGETLKFKVDRNGEKHSFDVTPDQASAQEGRFTIGVMPYTKGISVTRIVKGSMAENAGLAENDIIYMVNNTRVYTPADFSGYLQKNAGKRISVKFYRAGVEEKTEIVPVKTEIFVIKGSDGREESFAGNEEFEAMLKQGLVKIDGKTVKEYSSFLKDAENAEGRKVIFDIKDKRITGSIEINRRAMIGIEIGLVFDTVDVKMGPGEALVQSFAEPWQFTVMNIKGFGLLFSGKMDVRESISGPIRIAKIAGDVLYYRGASDFILLMAKISIILMIMNLLPIPAVDGSHLVFYTIEAIRGKPINEKIMARIQGFGIVFLITLGVFVIINDISMLPFVQNFFR